MLYPDFEELLQLGYRASKLNLISRRDVLSIVSGDHASPFRGKGLEFEEVREYVPGDDVRNIDWRVTARTGQAHLKLFTEERERSVILCNDVNYTMRFGTRGTFKSIQAAKAASLLGWAAGRSNNRVGGSFYGNVPDGQMFLGPMRSRRSLWRMLKQLCDHGDFHDRFVTLEDHLRYLNKAAPSGALVFIISDFMILGDNLKRRLADLHRRCDVVLVSVNDPADKFMPPVGPVQFSDSKGRKMAVDTADEKGGAAYKKLWEQNREQLKHIVNSLGLGHIALTTDGDVYFDVINGVRRVQRKGGYSAGPALATA